MSSWADATLARMRSETGRSGLARTRVVQHLAAQECCLSAQELHDGLRATGARVGIASVYRALETLAELGLAQRVDLGDGIARYERRHPEGDHHHHLVCEDCGRVEPFEDPALEAAIERVAGGRNYDVAAHDVVLRGACGDCRDGD